MNREWILFHLKEAQGELTSTIQDVEKDPEYDIGTFTVAMMHLYNHLNTAWNSKDKSRERVEACTVEEFAAWRKFPEDIDMSA